MANTTRREQTDLEFQEMENLILGGLFTGIENLIIKNSFTISAFSKPIVFKNVEFERNLIILNGSELIDLINCDFSILEIRNISCNKLELFNCQGNYLKVANSDIYSVYILLSSITNIEFEFNIFGGLDFVKNKDTSAQISSGNSINVLEIDSNLENFDLEIFHAGPLSDNVNEFSVINIEISANQSGKIIFNDITIDSFKMGGSNNSVTIEMRKVFLREVSFKYFYNSSLLIISNPKFSEESKLDIFNSHMGKTILFGVDFYQVKNIVLQDVNLTSLEYTQVKWCKSFNSKDGVYLIPSNRQRSEIFKQLKGVASKHFDKPNELSFYAVEMINYTKEIKREKINSEDLIVLRFNYFTNRHGTSWIRPFWLIVILVLLSYCIIKKLLGFNDFSLFSFKTLSEILECFNPVRKFSESFGLNGYVPDTNDASLARILDIILLRVLLGLLIYQMIKAFRKYVR